MPSTHYETHDTLWRCVNEPGVLIPDESCGCCWLPVCAGHGIPDCSPLLNGCRWVAPDQPVDFTGSDHA